MELDCADSRSALTALRQADFVVALQSYVTETMLTYADVILPMSSFSESSGTFVSIDSQWQPYTGAVSPKGESRPAWKVLRVLANLAEVDGFDYISSQDVSDEIRASNAIKMVSKPYWPNNIDAKISGVEVISEVPMYQTDSIVRRSSALANTIENKRAIIAKMNMNEAEKNGLKNSNSVVVCQDKQSVTMDFEVDNSIADGCIHMPAGVPQMSQFAATFSIVTVEANKQSDKDD